MVTRHHKAGMSWSRHVTFWCDECAHWEQIELTVTKARRALKQAGWICQDGKDFCPGCAKKRLVVEPVEPIEEAVEIRRVGGRVQ
jgi:hypothetical protein